MKVKNTTRFPFGAKVTARKPPQVEMAVIVRGAFVLAPGQPPVPCGEPGDLLAQGAMSAETYREDDEDRTGECLCPNDFADFKLKTDLLVRGTCYPPGGKAATECPVAFAVGSFEKTLRVVGPRAWSDGLGGAVISDPLPFTRMQIDYAHAFGGPGFAKNPAGKGLGAELPNVEDPRSPVRSRKDRPEPAGFGPVSPEWPQRRDKRGKEYGEKWKKTRAPFYSEDFDWTHFNCAPPDQQLEGYLRGDEDYRFHNLHPEAPVLAGRLPGIRVRAFVKDTSQQVREVLLRLDTLFADLDEGKLYLTWRGLDAVQTDDLTDVQTVLIADEPLASDPRPLAHYRELLEAFEKDPIGLEAHKPKGLPDAEEELAKAKEKLDKLTQASEALKKGGVAADDPLTGVTAPLVGLMDAAAGKEIAKRIAEAGAQYSRGLAPSPDGVGAAKVDVAALVRESSQRAPAGLPSKPGPALPAEGRDALKGLLKSVEAARDAAQKNGTALPKELEEALAGPMMASLLSDPDAGKPPPPPPGPALDLSGRDFSGKDLRGADLRRADLSRANLMGARLDGALLAGAKLHRTMLSDAVLSGADLDGADLTTAMLIRARADGATFRGAVLDQTVLTQADLTGARLDGATGKMTVFQGAKLGKVTAQKVRLEQGLFVEAELHGADLSFAVLARCLFLNAKARRARFEGASLDKTSFIDADLAEAVFLEAQGHPTAFLRCSLREADLRHATLRSSHFTESDATRAVFFAANLREARFYRAVLKDADLSQVNLFEADLCKALLSGAKLTGSNLYGAKLVQASGEGCDLLGANLKRSTLEGA
jgi:uncharacterized protein YjbI with pentapeptide repeats